MDEQIRFIKEIAKKYGFIVIDTRDIEKYIKYGTKRRDKHE